MAKTVSQLAGDGISASTHVTVHRGMKTPYANTNANFISPVLGWLFDGSSVTADSLAALTRLRVRVKVRLR